MKKVLLLLMTAFVVYGCEKKDEEHYFNNLDKAQNKIEQCQNDMRKASEKRDEKALLALVEDTECKAADSALKKQRSIEREQEEQKRLLEKQLQEEKEALELENLKNTIIEENKNLTWQEGLMEYLKTDCYQESKQLFRKATPECTAWLSYHEQESNKGLQELSIYSYEDLGKKQSEFCTKDQREGSPCTVWGEALTAKAVEIIENLDIYELEDREEEFCSYGDNFHGNTCKEWRKEHDKLSTALIKVFVNDYDQFKENFNSCVDAVEAMEKQDVIGGVNKSMAISKIKQSAPCKQASYAYSERKLGYYGVFTKKVE